MFYLTLFASSNCAVSCQLFARVESPESLKHAETPVSKAAHRVSRSCRLALRDDTSHTSKDLEKP